MLENCEKMLLISSPPPNEWPQNINHIDDPKQTLNNNNPNMASLAATITTPTGVGERIMDQKVGTTTTNFAHQDQQKQQHQLPQDQAVRCPRCDSTNTKFCYYNNYSLTQPRHFCKACKRYWTKGGTLRNVPVGGGCRKNKRVKRTSNNSSSLSNTSNTTSLNNTTTTNNNSASLEGSVNSGTSSIAGGCGLSSLSSSPGGPIHDLIASASNHHQSPMFYGFPTSNISFPFSRYDLQNPPQINGLGLGFSSGLVHNMNSMNIHHSNDNNNKQVFQDLISSNPLLSNYATTTTATTTTTTTATTTTTTPPTISSLLGSSLHQMKGNNNNNNNNFQSSMPSYDDDLHIKGIGNNGMYMKGVKMEFQGQNRSFDNNHWDTSTNTTNISTQNQMDQHHRPMGSSSDSSILWGNNNGVNIGAWLDPTNNLGSSVPSLI